MESEFISWDKIHKGTDKEDTDATSLAVAADPTEATDPIEKYKDLPVDEDGIRQFITKDMPSGHADCSPSLAS